MVLRLLTILSKRMARAKRTADVTAVRPVLPPAATPEADSTKVVVVEVPKTAPTEVATASAQSGEDVNRPWLEDPLDTDGWFRTGDGGTGIRF